MELQLMEVAMTERELLEDHYTEEELARMRGVSIGRLRNIFATGDHPPFIGWGARKRFPKDPALAWINAQMKRPRARRKT